VHNLMCDLKMRAFLVRKDIEMCAQIQD